LAPETRRAINLLKLGTTLPTPSDPAKRKELSMIATELGGLYGAGQHCRNDDDCLSGSELEGLMQSSKDDDELEEYWTGWRTIGPPMHDKYQRYVELANEGAAGDGFGSERALAGCP
jgi:peptidyl-dipeptidase A